MCGQQAGGEVDDQARHAEPAVEHDELVAPAGRGGPSRPSQDCGGPRRRALGDVAEHGERPGRRAATDGAQLHRARGPGPRRARRGPGSGCGRAGRRPRRGGPCRRGSSGPHPSCGEACPTSSIRCSSSVRMPSAASASAAASAEEREEHAGRVERRPQAADVGGDRRRAGDGVLHAVVGGVTGALHLEQHLVGEPLGEQARGRRSSAPRGRRARRRRRGPRARAPASGGSRGARRAPPRRGRRATRRRGAAPRRAARRP